MYPTFLNGKKKCALRVNDIYICSCVLCIQGGQINDCKKIPIRRV